jgi:2-polyprenyl-3-methyl-5-hydroxy-6-metoxy-1,4-benzoquinol methylase
VTPERSDPWFDELYRSAEHDLERIPWAHLRPRPVVVEWLDRDPPAPGTTALVIAAGLGDDAEELARRGCAVTAFDLSPKAIEIARRRFPGSKVDYRVADLFELPPEWRHAFEIVVEVQTIMSIPPEHHRTAIEAVAGTVAPGGRLLVRTAVRPEHGPAPQRPWPLAPSELRHFEELGMTERSHTMDGTFAHIEYRRTVDRATPAGGESA